MKIKKSKTKIIVLSVCSVLAIIGFLAYRVELYHRTNDPNKERIFEIEDYSHDRKLTPYGTEKDLQYNSESIRAFIIQNCPDNEEKTKALIYEFLNTYNYKNEMENCGTDKIYIDFMKPSWRFPVYWTEKWDMKHTWHRDGSYLANYYNSNRVAWVECDVNGILGENYYFDKTTSDYYVRGGKVPFDNQWKNRGGER